MLIKSMLKIVSHRGVAQPGSAPALGAGSRSPPEADKAILQGGLCALGAFKSSRPDQPTHSFLYK